MRNLILVVAASAMFMPQLAAASPETKSSPTGGALPTAVTEVGGVVLDLQGTNGSRVVTQLAASQLFYGYADDQYNSAPGTAEGNPLTFGTQAGFDSGVLSALGGLASASVRITLFDGDTAPFDFDFNENTLLLDGIDFGDWSSITTYQTNADGTSLIATGTGFGDGILSTGFFSTTDTTKLGALFAALADGSLAYQLFDTSPFDNEYDFTRGVDGGLINIGTGPIVTPPTGAVPEPATWMMMMVGFGFVAGAARYRRRSTKAGIA